jgi:hypothetical protein
MHDDSFFTTSNYIEASLWACIGLVFLVQSLRTPGPKRRPSLIAGLTFLVFGASDIVETTTGAWWRPWWLFMWKSVCVAIFLLLLAYYFRPKSQDGGPKVSGN